MSGYIKPAFLHLLLTAVLLSTSFPANATSDPVLRALLQEAIASDSGFEDRFAAEVWLLDMSRRLEKFIDDPKLRIDLLNRIHYEATRLEIEPELVLALIEVESNF